MPFQLDKVRKAKAMSKRRLARESGIAYPMIVRLCKKGQNPNWATITRLAKALGCSPGDFAGEPRK